jgi:hypothetical protein
MKFALALAAVLALVASPALAGDGNVSPSKLKALGLGGIKVVSDAEGMKVRGMSSNAATSGASFAGAFAVSGLNFAVAADTQLAASSAENAGLNAASAAAAAQVANALAVALANVALATASGNAAAAAQ